MSAAYVGSITGGIVDRSTAASHAFTLGAGVPAGDLVQVVAIIPSTVIGFISVTDSKGNSYTILDQFQIAGITLMLAIGVIANGKALATSDIVTTNLSSTGAACGFSMDQFTGTSATLDGTVAHAQTGAGVDPSTTWNSPSMVTNFAGDLLLVAAAINWGGGYAQTPSGGFTSEFLGLSSSGGSEINGQYKVGGATTTEQGGATATNNDTQVFSIIAALKAASTAVTVLPSADLATTGWTTTPLFSKVNDASDATVITATLA